MNKCIPGLSLAALTATLLTSLAGAQTSADTIKQQCAGAKTVVEFWHGFAGGAPKNTLEGLAAAFNRTQKGACVLPISQGNYTDLNTKLLAAFASGKVPTMAQAYANNISTYLAANQLDDLAKLGVKTTGLQGSFVQSDMFNGVLYGVPFNKSVQVLYYNKDLLSQSGVAVPQTLTDFGTAARTLSKKAGAPVYWFTPDASTFAYFYLTLGGTYGGNKLTINDPIAVKALDMLAQLVKDGAAKPITQGFVSDHLTNTYGLSTDTSASYTYMKSGAKFNVGVTTLPGTQAGHPGTALIQGTDIVVFSKASADQKAVAAKFLAFAESPRNSALFATATGYAPSNTLAPREPAFTSFLADNPTYAPILKQTRFAGFEPRISQWQQIRFDYLAKAVVDATVNKVPAKTALDRAQQQVNDLLAGRTK